MIKMTAARPLPKPRGGDVRSPRFEVVEAAVAAPGPAFLVVASQVRAERHPVGLEGRGKVSEDPGELTGRHVEQRGVREAPVEAGGWQVEREEVLMQHLAVRAVSVRARPVHGRVSVCQKTPTPARDLRRTATLSARFQPRNRPHRHH